MENTSVHTLTSMQACSEAVLTLIGQAEQQVSIFTQQLEPTLYNHQSICELLSYLARKNRHSMVRILAQQTKGTSDGHCLVRLAQRLSSSIQIRIPSTPELQNYTKSMLIIDNHSMMQIDNPERYEGTMLENNRLHVKSQLEFFDHAWEHSLPDQNTRRLQI